MVSDRFNLLNKDSAPHWEQHQALTEASQRSWNEYDHWLGVRDQRKQMLKKVKALLAETTSGHASYDQLAATVKMTESFMLEAEGKSESAFNAAMGYDAKAHKAAVAAAWYAQDLGGSDDLG